MRGLFLLLLLVTITIPPATTLARRVVVYHRGRNHRPFAEENVNGKVVKLGRHVSLVEKAGAEGEDEEEDALIFAAAGGGGKRTITTTPTPRGTNGTGVRVFVLDSGYTPAYFAAGGVTKTITNAGPSFVDGEPDVGVDPRGHGTAVLGIAAENAPGAEFTSVRVFSAAGSGSTSGLALALDWIAGECSGQPQKRCVANLSGGGFGSALLDRIATDLVVRDGVAFVAASGNNVASCEYSPGRADAVVGVAATTTEPPLPVFASSFSASGTCVDVLAPGDRISVATPEFPARAKQSGTSFAAPVVTAAVARAWEANPYLRAREIGVLVVTKLAARGIVTKVPGDGTPNRFIGVWDRGGGGGETLGTISAGPWFEQWRAEWGETGCVSGTGASAPGAVWQAALVPGGNGVDEFVPPPPFRATKTGALNTIVVMANGRWLRVKVGGRVIATVVDDARIAQRAVGIAVSGETKTPTLVVVSTFAPTRTRFVHVSVPLEGEEWTAHPPRITFANGEYAVDVLENARCGDGVTISVLPPCERRATVARCAAKSQVDPQQTCAWMGPRYACRPSRWCGFAERNACVAKRCVWTAGKGCAFARL